MADKSASADGNPVAPDAAVAASPSAPTSGTTPPAPRRGPGHRGAEVKDTVAEMAAKAHEISLEAGSKMAAAMRDVINAAAGLGDFVIESARDLVQYMVRRGQMTQDEADKLIRRAEEAQGDRPRAAAPAAKPAAKSAGTPVLKLEKGGAAAEATPPSAPAAKKVAAKKPEVKKAAAPEESHPHEATAEKPAVAKAPAAKKAPAKTAAPAKKSAKQK